MADLPPPEFATWPPPGAAAPPHWMDGLRQRIVRPPVCTKSRVHPLDRDQCSATCERSVSTPTLAPHNTGASIGLSAASHVSAQRERILSETPATTPR